MMRLAGSLAGLIKSHVALIRNLRDRLAHPERQADLPRKLERIGPPKRILVVCAGNVCRSPYLEAVLRRDLPDVFISSAGFVGANRPVPPFALEVSASRGVDLSAFRSKAIQPRLARQADMVIVMDPDQGEYISRYMGVSRARIVVAGDLDSDPFTRRSIEDPWQKSIDAFEWSFNRLDRCAATLVSILRPAGQSQPRPAIPAGPVSRSNQGSTTGTVHAPQLTT